MHKILSSVDLPQVPFLFNLWRTWLQTKSPRIHQEMKIPPFLFNDNSIQFW
ncbi:hypothetical protein OIU76_000326 [Salix suchowensis]|nr:hypothetical protein OIU76_000326 [Salix suchowensis]